MNILTAEAAASATVLDPAIEAVAASAALNHAAAAAEEHVQKIRLVW
ncbi:MAG: hypothetical protein ACP5P1_15225 [Acidimicrobiales bacterium]